MPSAPPRLHITSDDTEFDPQILRSLAAEGFSVSYLPCTEDRKTYRTALRHLGDDLELGEKYAILAYGDAGAECLDFYAKPQPGYASPCLAFQPCSSRQHPPPSSSYRTDDDVLL